MTPDELAALTFEEALGRLEKLTADVETGAMPLGRALDEFERGIKLAQHCRKILEAADGRVQKLAESGALEPFKGAEG